MLKLNFVNETKIQMDEYETLATKILSSGIDILKMNQYPTELTITFVTEDEALSINKQYRHKSYIPDVLSFPIEMTKQEIATIGIREIGDIFICFDEAKRKAIKYDHKIIEEMSFLFVHGFLHLLGYDHEHDLTAESEMFALQDQILKQNEINYTIKFVEEDYLEMEKIDE